MEEEEREIEYNSILNEEPKSPSLCDTSIKCGVCSKDLSSFEVEEREIHTNKCLDKLEMDANSSFSILTDSEEDDFIEISSKKAPTYCPICGTDITLLTILQQTKHVNSCCNKQSSNLKINSIQDLHNKLPNNLVSYCSACGINLSGKSDDFRIKHFKKCHREKSTKISELKEIKGCKNSQKSQNSNSQKKKEKNEKSSSSKSNTDSSPDEEQPPKPRKLVRNSSKNTFSPPTSSVASAKENKFLTTINKAHYRPKAKVSQHLDKIPDPSPPGEKDLAGFALSQQTQRKKQNEQMEKLRLMFPDDDSLETISTPQLSESNVKQSANTSRSLWKLSSKEIESSSDYHASLLSQRTRKRKKPTKEQEKDEEEEEEVEESERDSRKEKEKEQENLSDEEKEQEKKKGSKKQKKKEKKENEKKKGKRKEKETIAEITESSQNQEELDIFSQENEMGTGESFSEKSSNFQEKTKSGKVAEQPASLDELVDLVLDSNSESESEISIRSISSSSSKKITLSPPPPHQRKPDNPKSSPSIRSQPRTRPESFSYENDSLDISMDISISSELEGSHSQALSNPPPSKTSSPVPSPLSSKRAEGQEEGTGNSPPPKPTTAISSPDATSNDHYFDDFLDIPTIEHFDDYHLNGNDNRLPTKSFSSTSPQSFSQPVSYPRAISQSRTSSSLSQSSNTFSQPRTNGNTGISQSFSEPQSYSQPEPSPQPAKPPARTKKRQVQTSSQPKAAQSTPKETPRRTKKSQEPIPTPTRAKNSRESNSIMSPMPNEFVSKIQEVIDWYKDEVQVCEEQKNKAIMEIERNYYAQVGRLAIDKDQKLKSISERFQAPEISCILLQLAPPAAPSTRFTSASQPSTLVHQSEYSRPSNSQVSSQPIDNITVPSKATKRGRGHASQISASQNPAPAKKRKVNGSTESLSQEAGADDDELLNNLGVAIKDSGSLWNKILLQQTVTVHEVQEYLKSVGITCSIQILSAYLREEGVLFKANKGGRKKKVVEKS